MSDKFVSIRQKWDNITTPAFAKPLNPQLEWARQLNFLMFKEATHIIFFLKNGLNVLQKGYADCQTPFKVKKWPFKKFDFLNFYPMFMC